MSETTSTPAAGTWGTVAPYGLGMRETGRGNPAALRALYVGVGPGAWDDETGERAAVHVLELESGERYLVETAATLARIFRADRPAGIAPDARTPIGARVRELRTGAVGTIAAGASSAAVMVRLETGPEAGASVYGMHPSELELISAEQYLSARYSAASLPAAPELAVGVRVAVHPAADLWMRGVRYGTVYSAPYRQNGRELIGITADSGQRFAAAVADLSVAR